jgi:hypothetical protein
MLVVRSGGERENIEVKTPIGPLQGGSDSKPQHP